MRGNKKRASSTYSTTKDIVIQNSCEEKLAGSSCGMAKPFS
jgi:hypothetical protein